MNCATTFIVTPVRERSPATARPSLESAGKFGKTGAIGDMTAGIMITAIGRGTAADGRDETIDAGSGIGLNLPLPVPPPYGRDRA